MVKVLVNVSDITHIKPLSKIYMLQLHSPCFMPFCFTRYGLDGPGIESRWGQDFLHPSRPTQPPIQ
jgi:hypothetical protein